MKRVAAVLLTLLAFAALADAPAAVTTVILVRHAEKNPDPALEDPELTPAGQERARELARVLGATKIEAIYTTPFERTRQTAAPVAQALKLQSTEIKTGPTYAAEMAARIRKDHRGGTVLVVGHSNSTANVMKELGIAGAPFIPESEYDNLFIVTLAEGHAPRMVALRYGAVVR